MSVFILQHKKVVFICVILLLSCFPQLTHAKQTISDAPQALSEVVGRTGVSQTDVPSYAGGLIKGILTGVGIAFFILMFYAGFRWITARGEEEKITSARRTMVNALLGLIVIVAAYAITNFVTRRVVEGRANDGGTPQFENNDFVTNGCCFDQVRHPDGGPLEMRATTWQWRITSKGDCQEQGNKTTSFDEIAGPGTWSFIEVSSVEQCRAAFDTFCEQTDCYDLGF